MSELKDRDLFSQLGNLKNKQTAVHKMLGVLVEGEESMDFTPEDYLDVAVSVTGTILKMYKDFFNLTEENMIDILENIKKNTEDVLRRELYGNT